VAHTKEGQTLKEARDTLRVDEHNTGEAGHPVTRETQRRKSEIKRQGSVI